MKREKFDVVISTTLETCADTLLTKSKEYSRNNNPLHNFDVGVNITGKSREDVIWGMALKHFISVQDIKEDVKNGKYPTKELLDEKYGDLINYLLIEKASLIDKIQ